MASSLSEGGFLTVFDRELSDTISETRMKLNAHCSDCRFVCQIDWKAGRTELSGYCHVGNVYLLTHDGGRGSLNQKRRCGGYEHSSDADQTEKVQKKILEAEAVMKAFLRPHSSQLTSSSQVTSAGSLEQEPAGTVEKPTNCPNKKPGRDPPSGKISDRGAAGMGNHLARER